MSRPDLRVDAVYPGDASVVPVERDPITGRVSGFDRSRKNRAQDHRPSVLPGTAVPPARPESPRRGARVPLWRRTWLVIGAALITVAIIVGAVLIGSSGRSTHEDAAAGGPSSAPASVSGTPSSEPSADPVTSVSTMQTPTTASLGPSTGSSLLSISGVSSTAKPTASSSATALHVLDPAWVVGYQAAVTHTHDRMGGVPVAIQGEVVHGAFTCTKQLCDPSTSPVFLFAKVPFKPGVPRVDWTQTSSAGGVVCTGDTATLTLTLDRATGRYHGRYLAVPEVEESSFCTASYFDWAVELIPVVAPDLSAVPLGTAAALNPSKITGYQGTARTGTVTTPVRFSCARGVCWFSCPTLCAGTGPVLAAAPAWTIAGLSPAADCGAGVTKGALSRAPDGGYSGTVTTVYAGPVGTRSCPASMTVSLKPVISSP